MSEEVGGKTGNCNSRSLRDDNQKSNGKSRSRSPSRMTERKARAKAKTRVAAAMRLSFLFRETYRRSARMWSATRMALAMMVREGLTALAEGKKLASTT